MSGLMLIVGAGNSWTAKLIPGNARIPRNKIEREIRNSILQKLYRVDPRSAKPKKLSMNPRPAPCFVPGVGVVCASRQILLYFVPRERVELSRPYGQWILSPSRLPFRHRGIFLCTPARLAGKAGKVLPMPSPGLGVILSHSLAEGNGVG